MNYAKVYHKNFGRKVICLTGGICSGKSFVLHYLRILGSHIFSSDQCIVNNMQPGGKIFHEIQKTFPECIINGKIDKKLLGNIVFFNRNALSKLEVITHPVVLESMSEFINTAAQHNNKPIVLEVPLFFEIGLDRSMFDSVVSTICPVEIQRHRAFLRKGMTEEKINAILLSQVSNDVRLEGSDYIIDTSRSRSYTLKQLKFMVLHGSS